MNSTRMAICGGIVVGFLLLGGVAAAQVPDPTKDIERRNEALSALKGFAPVCFSPDGKTLFLARFDPMEETEAVVWDLEVGKERQRFRWSGATSATFSPDGRLALVSKEGRLTLRSVTGGRDVSPLLRGLFYVHPVVFSRDGKWMAALQTTTKTSVLKVWDAAIFKEKAAIRYEEGCNPTSFWFSPDGKTIGAGFLYGSLRTWDVATGKTRDYYPADPKEEVYLRDLSPDLKSAVVQERTGKKNRNGTLKLWEPGAGKKRVLFEGGQGAPHPAEVAGCHFSQDGKVLALGLEYHEGGAEVIVLEVATGKKLLNLPGSKYCVTSPDGKLLAVQSEKETVRLHRLP
jgi:WD40 repeat protein